MAIFIAGEGLLNQVKNSSLAGLLQSSHKQLFWVRFFGFPIEKPLTPARPKGRAMRRSGGGFGDASRGAETRGASGTSHDELCLSLQVLLLGQRLPFPFLPRQLPLRPSLAVQSPEQSPLPCVCIAISRSAGPDGTGSGPLSSHSQRRGVPLA